MAASVRRLIQALRNAEWTGASDAALVPIWQSLADEFPKAKWVVCKRDLSDVFESCKKIIPDMPVAGVGELASQLDLLIAELNPMIVQFDDISPVTCFDVADHLGVKMGSATRVRQLCDFNVQIHPPILQERLKALICQPIKTENIQTK
jgi:hypothetical protein